MLVRTLISLNLDKTPLVSLDSQDLVYGVRFQGEMRAFKDTGPHRHDVASIGCVDSGMICIQNEKESFIVTAGMVVFTSLDCVHIEAGMGCPVTDRVVLVPTDRVKFMPSEIHAE
ncbi:MAG: hypothetical protein K1X29_07965 [Bdellovibrionales bacterium]|nr:hypothetical protein [Bdellovibrionales bacterium]